MARRSNLAEASPASKRPKLEEPDAPAIPGSLARQQSVQDTFKPRYDRLWPEDGSVIIVAIGLSFKVRSSILRRHSSVFRELLGEPGATDRAETGRAKTFEGYRVLRFTDKGDALAEFLNILYDSGNRYVHTPPHVGPRRSRERPFFDRKAAVPSRYLERVTRRAVQSPIYHRGSYFSPGNCLSSHIPRGAGSTRVGSIL